MPAAGAAAALLTWALLGGCRLPVQPDREANRPARVQSEDDLQAAYLRALLVVRPDHWRARVRLSDFHTRAGRHLEAFSELQRAAETVPESPGLHAALAAAGETLDYLDWALHAWRTAVRLAPRDPAPRLGLARLYRALGWYGEASIQLEQAAGLAPDDVAVLRERAGLHAVAGPMPTARALAERLVQKHPRLPFGHSLLGDLAARSSNWSKAVEHARSALARAPEDAAFRLRLAEFCLARPDAPSPEEALQLADAVLAAEPEHPGALAVRAEALGRLGRTIPAEEALFAAYRLGPERDATALRVAEVYRRTGREKEAADLLQLVDARKRRAREFERAAIRVLTEPHSAAAHARMAEASLPVGRTGQALVELLTARRLGAADGSLAPSIRKCLDIQGRTPESLAPLPG